MPKKVNKISRSLLSWYDREARDLPWRKFGKDKQDPYKVWISEIMLQQTTVSVVIPYFNAFIKKWPTNKLLSQASLSEIQRAWSGLGYYSRARNLFECSVIINSRFNNNFPESEKELLKLPGIGAYTAAAISAIAFNNRSVVIDGNIKRVISRLFLLKKPIKNNYNEIWKFTDELFDLDDLDQIMIRNGVGVDQSEFKSEWKNLVDKALVEAKLKIPQNTKMISGGKKGKHTSSFSELISEMQYIPRKYPDAKW